MKSSVYQMYVPEDKMSSNDVSMGFKNISSNAGYVLANTLTGYCGKNTQAVYLFSDTLQDLNQQ